MTIFPAPLFDIVIPVYNGLDFVRACYQSVRKHTAPRHHIIIVDDASTENALHAFYDSLESHEHTHIIRQKQNRGFVHSANTGMRFSSRHIVLLNSDTVVTPKWLEKLSEALFSDIHIGTVTPWTNNGTICSFPRFCADNDLPDKIDAAQLSRIAEQTADDHFFSFCGQRGAFLQLPTAVGFCMAIRRELINAIGVLDEAAYGRGYAEENDFCQKAIQAGFVNIMDHHTFIEHKGSLTFQGEKQQQLEKNLALLGKRFPHYFADVQRFIDTDAARYQRQRMQAQVERQQGKIHILLVLHNDPFGQYGNPPGGTEHHVLQLARGISKQADMIPLLLVVNGVSMMLCRLLPATEDTPQPHWRKQRIFLDQPVPQYALRHSQFESLFYEILISEHIDIVHFHHLIYTPLQLTALFQPPNRPAWQGKILFTLHDFYMLCPSFNLLDAQDHYCQGGTAKKCTACAKQRFDLPVDVNGHWRRLQTANLQLAEKIYLPSQDTANILKPYFTQIADKFCVREHGVDPATNAMNTPKPAPVSSQPSMAGGERRLTIAFIGGLAKPKGSQFIAELLQSEAAQEYEWVIIGVVGDPALAQIKLPNVSFHGSYNQRELPGILDHYHIDLIALVSIWPETFSYTLSEALLAGRAVITAPLGAPAQRLETCQCGWVLKELTTQHFFEQLDTIRQQPAQLQQKQQILRNFKHKSVAQMVAEYIQDYRDASAGLPTEAVPRQMPMPLLWPRAQYKQCLVQDTDYPLFYSDLFHHQPYACQQQVQHLEQQLQARQQQQQDLQRQYEQVLRSTTWRLLAPLRALIIRWRQWRMERPQ